MLLFCRTEDNAVLSHCVHASRVQREKSGFCVKSAHFLRANFIWLYAG